VITRPLERGASQQASFLRPNLIVIEHLNAYSPGGLELAREIRRTNPSIPLILATERLPTSLPRLHLRCRA